MRILIVGAGATGGSFGARLIAAGRDVTFLVRPARAEALRRDGLTFASPGSEQTYPVTALVAGEDAEPFDLILITVKAEALGAAIDDIRSYVAPHTLIAPILNGMAQIDRLTAVYPGQVIGGLAKIVATQDGGVVRQLTGLADLTLGGLSGDLAAEVVEAFRVPGIQVAVSDDITSALWSKWAFIAAGCIVSCLFRGPVGATIEAGGMPFIDRAIAETEAVAAAAGHPVDAAAHGQSVALLEAPGSAFTTSLYRDLDAGLPTEAEHILGDLAERARTLGVTTALLDLTLVQARSAEIQRRATGA